MYIENVKALYAPIGVKVAITEMYIAHVPEAFPNTNAGLARAGYGEKVWQIPVTTGIKIYITNKNIGGAAAYNDPRLAWDEGFSTPRDAIPLPELLDLESMLYDLEHHLERQ
jgi:hypothetical protein